LESFADKGDDGLLDTDGSDAAFAEMVQGFLAGNLTHFHSQAEWLESVKKLVLRDEARAAMFLELCERHLSERKESWPLRELALDVFRIVDRNGDEQLDMDEVMEVRESADRAQAVIDMIDVDKNGVVSQGKRLAYVKRLADLNEEAATSVLELYMKQLSRHKSTETDAGKKDELEDCSALTTQRWWACSLS